MLCKWVLITWDKISLSIFKRDLSPKLKVWYRKTHQLIQNVAPVMIKMLRSKIYVKNLEKNENL